jgi:hypothetical protein
MQYRGGERRNNNALSEVQQAKGIIKRTLIEEVPIIEQPRRANDIITRINKIAEAALTVLIRNDSKNLEEKIKKEQYAFIENIEDFITENYEIAFNTLKKFQFIENQNQIPSLQCIQGILKNELTPQQKKIIKTFQNPVFLIFPNNISGNTLIQKLYTFSTEKPQEEPFICNNSLDLLNESDKYSPYPWKIIITEETPNIEKENMEKESFQKRFKWFLNTHTKNKIGNIPIKEYIFLQMHSVAKKSGTMLDIITETGGERWNLFTLKHPFVFGGFFDEGAQTLCLIAEDAKQSCPLSRFRRSVTIDIKA